jgi:hypothetical protein
VSATDQGKTQPRKVPSCCPRIPRLTKLPRISLTRFEIEDRTSSQSSLAQINWWSLLELRMIPIRSRTFTDLQQSWPQPSLPDFALLNVNVIPLLLETLFCGPATENFQPFLTFFRLNRTYAALILAFHLLKNNKISSSSIRSRSTRLGYPMEGFRIVTPPTSLIIVFSWKNRLLTFSASLTTEGFAEDGRDAQPEKERE